MGDMLLTSTFTYWFLTLSLCLPPVCHEVSYCSPHFLCHCFLPQSGARDNRPSDHGLKPLEPCDKVHPFLFKFILSGNLLKKGKTE
jgi:hypothetical protein